jgi:hypothetical protein
MFIDFKSSPETLLLFGPDDIFQILCQYDSLLAAGFMKAMNRSNFPFTTNPQTQQEHFQSLCFGKADSQVKVG